MRVSRQRGELRVARNSTVLSRHLGGNALDVEVNPLDSERTTLTLSASCRNLGTRSGIEGAKTISNKIFVGNLNFATTDQELRELFNEVGEVVDVYIPTDRETGRPRGFAFVRFASEEQAAKAVEEVHGREVGGRPLRLDIAEDRRRPSRPQPQRDYGEPPPEPRSFDRFDKFDKFDKSKKSKGSRRGLRARKRSL